MAWWNFSTTAASNGVADPTQNWSEGMSPSAVNDSARALLARSADFRDLISGKLVTTGTGTALVLASGQNPVFDTLAHMDGQMFAFVVNATNTGPVTLAVDGLTAKPIRSQTGSSGELGAGVLNAGTPYVVTYYNSAGEFLLQGYVAQIVPPGAEQAYAGLLLPVGWLWEDGSAVLRATYPALLDALTVAINGDTHTNTTLDNITGPPGVDIRLLGLIGAIVEGSGIPVGTTIVSFPSANSITLSAAATATASAVAIRLMPWGQGDAVTTFNVPDRRERTLFGRGGMGGTSSPGRITAYDATSINTAIGLESFSLAQANLPNVNFTVTGTVNVTDTHKHFIANSDVGSGLTPLKNSNYLMLQHSTGSSNDYTLQGTATVPTLGLTSLTADGSITAALASAVAASGGAGTAVKKIDPGGVTNWIIKY